MPLRLVCGRAGTGKSEYLLDEIAALKQQGEKVVLLVPEQYSHQAELSIIRKIGFLSGDVQALSFKRMANNACKEFGAGRDRLDGCGKSMLLTRVLFRLRKELSYFGRISTKPGFVDELCSFVSELKKGGVTPEELNRQAKNAEGVLGKKLADLAKLYEAYEQLLEEKLLDSDDLLTILSKLVTEKKAFLGVHIYLDEFVKLTSQEMACVEAFLANGNRITATIPSASLDMDENSVFAPAAATAERLMFAAGKQGQRVEAPVFLSQPYRFHSKELAVLEQHLFGFGGPGQEEPTERIELVRAPSPYAEVTILAAAIRRAVREQGLHYRDIAVIAGDFEQYQELVKTVFPSFHIPVFTDQTTDLLSHPILMMLMSALAVVTSGFRTEDVLAYLKSGYAGLSPEEVDELENMALERAIRGKDWLADERFCVTADNVLGSIEETPDEDTARIISNKNRALEPLVRFRKRLSADRSAESRAAAIALFLEEVHLEETLKEQIRMFEEAGLAQLAQRYDEVYQIVTELLEQFTRCLGTEKLGLDQLRDTLLSGLGQYSFGTIPPSLDEVFLGDMGRSRVKNVSVLFVVGAVEGTFPPRLSESGLLSDSERIVLMENGLELAPDTRRRTLDARMEVYQTMTIASNQIVISYPAADAEGRGTRPSRMIGQLKGVFPRLKTTELGEDAPPEEKIGSPESAFRYVLPHIGSTQARYRAVEMLLKHDSSWLDKLTRAENDSRFRNQVGALSVETAHRLYGSQLHGSVSRFENYTSCPYSYFLKYGLKAKERRILKLNTPDIGWLLHEVIDTFSRRLISLGIGFGTVDEQACEALIDEIIGELTDKMFIKRIYAGKKFETLIRRLKRLVMRSVWVICEHVRAGSFEPCAFEFTFEENGDIPPVTIDLPTGDSVTLTGRIDRIDRYTVGDTAYIKIIDYKSGSKEFTLSDVYHRLNLQLALYVDAVWENGQGKLGDKVCPAGMFYFRLMDPIMRTASIPDEEAWRREMLKQFRMSGLLLDDPGVIGAVGCGAEEPGMVPIEVKRDGTPSSLATMEQFGRLREYIKRTVGEIGREILNGDIRLAPYYYNKNKPCDYCSFCSVCGFDPDENKYRVLRPMPAEDVWQRLDG